MLRSSILLLDGETFFARKVVRSLAHSGRWRIHVLGRSGGEMNAGLQWSRHVEAFHVVAERASDEEYLAAIERAVHSSGASLILPVIESTVLFCIRHREALLQFARLAPLPTEESFLAAVDKGTLAGVLAKHGIPHPATRLADSVDLGGLQMPVLLKPRRSSGGRGIQRIETASQLAQELERGASEECCVQEYVEGTDAGCSVLAVGGRLIAWTTQHGVRRTPSFAAHEEVRVDTCVPVLEVTKRLIRALDWSGVANIDFRIDASGRPQVLEVNGRYWNSLLASTLAGVNFPDLVCRLTLGERLPPAGQRSGRFVHPRTLVRDTLQRVRRGSSTPWTGLSMTLSDPLPELSSALQRRCFATAAGVRRPPVV